MPRSYRCSFCGKNFMTGVGSMHVSNDGTVLYFCSNKCRKNELKLGRDARKLKWTTYYGKRERGR
ncbi:MAG: 50S ribosomal protein L24e [archaeon]